jgi:catechol 2,3-dioxygenase-like lactoylglutathione lyase family enzyme
VGDSGIPVAGVSELVLEVIDLEDAEHFYSVLLGLPVVERWPARDAVWLMAGRNTRIGLWKPQVGVANGRGGIHVHFAMHIDGSDYRSAVDRLKSQGLEVQEEDFEEIKSKAVT